ncbi:hypothetical protein M426DRAFT_78265 [Hypoxylon sp. CI-4A]|nr:hypothetical protein M426DRAFT_78265 [Hypoxylon sp. CI-4A]
MREVFVCYNNLPMYLCTWIIGWVSGWGDYVVDDNDDNDDVLSQCSQRHAQPFFFYFFFLSLAYFLSFLGTLRVSSTPFLGYLVLSSTASFP